MRLTTLSDIVRDLRHYDEEPVSFQQPTIYVEEPWVAGSKAVVSWSMQSGGLPSVPAELRLVRLIEVRSALRLLLGEYDLLVTAGRLDELCALLVARVRQLVHDRDPYMLRR
jgi:hypothetical protein